MTKGGGENIPLLAMAVFAVTHLFNAHFLLAMAPTLLAQQIYEKAGADTNHHFYSQNFKNHSYGSLFGYQHGKHLIGCR